MFNRNKRSDSLADCLGLLAVALFVLCFCRDLLISGQVPYFRDLGTYFYPLRYALHESYNVGKLPLWNRHMGMGFPMLADFQSGVFYPPHLLFAVLPFFSAIRALFIGHFLIAGTGAYMLLRHWRYPVYLSIIGAVLFSLGGTTVALTNLLNHFQTAVWLPWMALAWERLLLTASWKRFVLCGVIWAVAFLAGSPEMFVLCVALVLVDGLRLSRSELQLSYRKVLLLFCGVGLLWAGLVMVQALPTAELFLQSRRAQPIPPQEALYWSLDPLNLLNLFFIDKISDPSAAIGLRFFFRGDAPFLVSYYLGAFSLFGIALCFCFTSRREKVVLLALISVSLIFALGSYTPVYPFLFRHLPLLGAVRFPEKFFFFTFVILVYMALRGIKGFLHDSRETTKRAYVVVSLICLSWLGLYLYLRLDTLLVLRFLARIGARSTSSAATTVTADILSNVERQLILSSGFLLLFILAATKTVRRPLIHVLLVSAVFVDFAWAHKDFLFVVDPDLLRQSPRILRPAELDGKRLFYSASQRNLHPSSVVIEGQPSYQQATAVITQNLLPNTGTADGVDYMQDINALAREPYAQFLSFANEIEFARQLKLLRLSNIGYIVSFRELSADGISLVRRFPRYYSWLYKVDGSVPRAYVVSQIRAVDNAAAVLPLLSTAPFDPAHEVVLQGKVRIKANHRPLLAAAKIARYEDSRVSIQVTSNDDAVLVLTDSYYPGWRAYLDGKQTDILRANHFFRAVVIPEGTHRIEFIYEPDWFRLGALVSLMTLFTIIGVSAFLFIRKRNGLSAPL
jgi:hypothetical protein